MHRVLLSMQGNLNMKLQTRMKYGVTSLAMRVALGDRVEKRTVSVSGRSTGRIAFGFRAI